MLCLSVNVRKLKVFIAVILAIMFCAGIFIMIKNKPDNSIILPTEASRIGFLNINGCNVYEEPVECSAVTIPAEFNEVYNAYNEIQLQQGFDLSDYKGEKADIYTYKMQDNSGLLAVLIICNDKLIGCEKHSQEYGSGFERILD